MKNLTRLTVLSSLSLLALASATFGAGCSESSTTTGGDSGTTSPDGGASESCDTAGTGSAQVTVTGLPAGVAAKVKLTGPGSPVDVTETKMLADQAAGTYVVTAERVTVADPIVRTVYVPTITETSVCVGKESVATEISYAKIPTSNMLWSTNGNSDSGQMLGFGGSVLAASGSPPANVAMKGVIASAPGKAVAFDKDGNMWSFGATVGDTHLMRFPASVLGASGEKTPDRAINPQLTGCSPSLSGLAFDPSGALWATVLCDNKILRIGPDTLAASGDYTPADESYATGTTSPRGIAFDKSGNMWVSDETSIHLFPAASLAAGQAHVPSFKINAKTEGDAELTPDALAFDKDGNLWASSFGGNIIYKLTPAQLNPEGTEKTLVPSVVITLGVDVLLYGLAFDESGGLWVTYGQGKIARVAPDQLGTSTGAGDPTIPTTVISSADLGYSDALAFFPAPAALPLYSAVP